MRNGHSALTSVRPRSDPHRVASSKELGPLGRGRPITVPCLLCPRSPQKRHVAFTSLPSRSKNFSVAWHLFSSLCRLTSSF